MGRRLRLQREAAYGHAAEAPQAASEALKTCFCESGCRERSRACIRSGRRDHTSRIHSTRPITALSARHPGAVALAVSDSGAIGAGPERSVAALEPCQILAHGVGANSFLNNLSCLYPTYVRGEAFSRLGRAALPPPSFRRFSTTAASSGTVGRERWRILAWLVPMPCSREPRRERTPMPPASGRSPPTKISSPSGKMPTLISPPEASQGGVREAAIAAR